MKITKFGHCCLLIEDKGVRILTDPGNYTTEQDEIKNINVVLITHEHADHFHIESVKKVLANNPTAHIVTNKAVSSLLKEQKIESHVLNTGELFHVWDKDKAPTHEEVSIEAFEVPHAVIHESLPRVPNTGFLIADRLFYPGDALINPHKLVEILALPVAGPWIKISEAIDYALELKPKKCFPVHDAGLKSPDVVYRIHKLVLEPEHIEFVVIDNDASVEF